MQYLTVQESVRRIRAAGLKARAQTVRAWIREEKIRDVLVLGRHTFIYDEELDAAIAREQQSCGAAD
jgi:hypothetical protein